MNGNVSTDAFSHALSAVNLSASVKTALQAYCAAEDPGLVSYSKFCEVSDAFRYSVFDAKIRVRANAVSSPLR
jgi:hypothetical protein